MLINLFNRIPLSIEFRCGGCFSVCGCGFEEDRCSSCGKGKRALPFEIGLYFVSSFRSMSQLANKTEL